MQTGAPLPASGSEAACSLFEGLEGTPTWLELHSVLRGKEPAGEQEKYIIKKKSVSNHSSQKLGTEHVLGWNPD